MERVCTMDKNDPVYVRLQRHLDKQAVGFPATETGAEIRILKHIFTPKQAEIATHLNYKPEPVETIFERAKHLVASPSELEKILDDIQRNGGIATKRTQGKKYYSNLPLAVGMFEMQLERLSPQFVNDFNAYTGHWKFGVSFLSTELPQMRTIPVEKSIQPQHHVHTFDEVTALVQRAEAPFVVIECICRKMKAMEGTACKVTDRKHTCLSFGNVAQMVLFSGFGREIDRDEVMSIIDQNQKDGLVLQPSNTEQAEFICSCCGCCCEMLQVHKRLPKPLDFWATNFYAVVEADACNGCGVCEKRCQVGAVGVSAQTKKAVVDSNLCIGCGHCASICPKDAIRLSKKQNEVTPPATWDDLYDVIMAAKKGKLGRIKLSGKLFVDAIKMRRFDLLKQMFSTGQMR